MYVQLFRRASCALPQQQEVLVRKTAGKKEIVLLFLNVLIQKKTPNLLESKTKQIKKPPPKSQKNPKRSTMKSLFLVSCKQTAGKCVKEETGNFYWKQLYLLVCFTKQASMLKSRVGVPFVYGWEPLVLIYPLPGGLGGLNSSPE